MTLARRDEVNAWPAEEPFRESLCAQGRQNIVPSIMWWTSWSEQEQLRVAVVRDVNERKQHTEAMQAACMTIFRGSQSSEDLQRCLLIHQIIGRLLPA